MKLSEQFTEVHELRLKARVLRDTTRNITLKKYYEKACYSLNDLASAILQQSSLKKPS